MIKEERNRTPSRNSSALWSTVTTNQEALDINRHATMRKYEYSVLCFKV